jgi:hypothetical protein
MDAVRCVKQASGDVTTHLVDITGAGEFKLYNEGDNTHPTVKFHLAVLPRRRARLCSHLHRVHYNERDAATTSTAAFTTILSRCGNASARYGSIQVRCDLGKLSCPRDSLSMSQKPQVASKDEQIPPLLAAHSLQGARELHCPYTRLKVAPHVVGIQGQGVRAVQ